MNEELIEELIDQQIDDIDDQSISESPERKLEDPMDDYELKNKDTEIYQDIRDTMKHTFGYHRFKPFQYQIIDNIRNGNDVLGVMPTGYGKSICFQMMPLVTNELAIIISPLLSLMEDQRTITTELGIDSCCYNSTLTHREKEQMEEDLLNNKYQLMYITPESLGSNHVKKLINNIYSKVGICVIAIDEAHCLSSYGFDFRPAYRKINDIRSILTDVPVLAVTATATENVINDIKTLMGMEDCVLIKTSFDRPNLNLHVGIFTQNTINNIVNIINNSAGPSIIYCVTKKDTERMTAILVNQGIETKAYHSGMKNDVRDKVQDEFMSGKISCIAATIAFGMGINKSDVRVVIHYGCPQNIESYYQEIGRAGRDGKESDCYLYYRPKDFIIQQKFISQIKDPRYKVVKQNLLKIITKYITTNECRRKYVLKYFGQDYAEDNCGKCDNCNHVEKTIDAHEQFFLFQVLHVVLSIKTEMGCGYGKNTIALILKGSASKKIKEWMTRLTFYGAMRKSVGKDIEAFIDKVFELGYLEQENVGKYGSTVYVLKCSDRGIRFGKRFQEAYDNMVKRNKAKAKAESKSKSKSKSKPRAR